MTIVDEAEDEDHLYSYRPFKQKMRQKECIVDKANGEDFIFSTTKGVLSWNHLKNACPMLNNFPCVKVMRVKSSKFAQSFCLIVLTLAYCEEKNWMQIKVDEQSPHLPHSLAKQWFSSCLFPPLWNCISSNRVSHKWEGNTWVAHGVAHYTWIDKPPGDAAGPRRELKCEETFCLPVSLFSSIVKIHLTFVLGPGARGKHLIRPYFALEKSRSH